MNWSRHVPIVFSAVARQARLRRRIAVSVAGSAAFIAYLTLSAGAQFPVTIADTISLHMFGGREDPAIPNKQHVPDICVAPPSVSVSAPAVPEPNVEGQSPAGADISATPEVQVQPAPGLTNDGRPTEVALAVIDEIPVGADIYIATGWIMYRLAHPGPHPLDNYAAFSDAFSATAKQLSVKATPTDVVTTIDPSANYAPYLLLAEAGAYKLMRQGSLTATAEQSNKLITALGDTCAGPEGTGKRQYR